MSIVRKVKSVERLFAQLDARIATFQSHTHLHCLAGCGHCCTKPDIDASPLEFLPFAFDLFLKGQAETTLEKLQHGAGAICIIYAPTTPENPSKGQCSVYAYRGLICRLFGYGATRDKHGQLRLATCRLIKESQAEFYEQTVTAIQQGLEVPIFTDYYQKLYQIDMQLGSELLPVNEAIRSALETVLHHYAYRPFPKHLRAKRPK